MTAVLKVYEGGTAQTPLGRRPSPTSLSEGIQWQYASDEHHLLAQRISMMVTKYLQEQTSSDTWHRNEHRTPGLSDELPTFLEEIGRLKPGWAGPHAKAPSPAVLDDIQVLASILPLGTRTPAFEVDPSDGEVKLAWRSNVEPRSIALALSGNQTVRVLQVHASQETDTPYLELGLASQFIATAGRRIQLLAYRDLFLGE